MRDDAPMDRTDVVDGMPGATSGGAVAQVAAEPRFPSDTGKIGLLLLRGELGVALGIEGARRRPDIGEAIAVIGAAVSQSIYECVWGIVDRTAERKEGIEGVRELHGDFGHRHLRRLSVDVATLEAMMGHGPVARAFAIVRSETELRERRRARATSEERMAPSPDATGCARAA